MRIKFLAIIASFLFVSIAISSCLDSDDNTIELSSDATVHAFGIDTIYGKYYKFTIDQLNRVIYNQDSLPVGADTIIDRILVDTFSVSGWITAGINDTIFNNADSVNLTGALTTNKETGAPIEDGMTFKVYAPAGNFLTYTLKINRHNLVPDSLVWNKMGAGPSTDPQKAILFNEELWVFTQNAAYRTSVKPNKYEWQTAETYDGFPANAKLETLVNVKYEEQTAGTQEKLYIVTTDNTVFASQNGSQWEIATDLGSDVQALIASFPNVLTVITKNNEIYSTGDEGVTKEPGEFSGADYPTENIYSTNFESNYQPQAMIVGKPNNSGLKQTVPWVSSNGNYWVPLNNTAYDTFCPVLKNPVVTYYGNNYYIFGSETDNKLDVIYSSVDGISWRKTEKKFLLDKDITATTAPYSIVVDSPYIWIVFGGNGSANTIWRGHLNKLLFTIQ